MSLALLTDQATGTHPASWIHPDTHASASTDINHFRAVAQLAERGKFDMFFVADTPATRTENLHAWSRFPMYMNQLEPLTLLTALACATTRIGLGGTVSTSFSEPYNVARQFVSLDLISSGRAAWNVVTSANDYAARKALPAGRRVRGRRARALGQLGRRRFHSRQEQRRLLRSEAYARSAAPGRVLPNRRRPQHRARATGTPGHHSGGRLRHRSRAGGANGRSGVRKRRRPRKCKGCL